MATTLLSGQPCQVLDALAQFQYEVISRLNKKIAALRRIAELLEQLGDLTTLAPNIGALIPISSINLDTYVRLQTNCPFLHLPDVSEGNLAELRQKVMAAYGALVRKLLNHPFIRMGKLQDALTRFQNDINAGAGVVNDYLTCLQTICDTIGQAETAFQKINSANIKKEVADYTKNYVQNAGQVLSEPQRIKQQELMSTVTQIRALSTDVVSDAQAVRGS